MKNNIVIYIYYFDMAKSVKPLFFLTKIMNYPIIIIGEEYEKGNDIIFLFVFVFL